MYKKNKRLPGKGKPPIRRTYYKYTANQPVFNNININGNKHHAFKFTDFISEVL